jgi:hypothetical protein
VLAAARPSRGGAQDATPPAAPGLSGAVAWLASQQGPDGGFIGFSGTSDPGVTADAVIALAAANAAGAGVDLAPAVAYLETHAAVYTEASVARPAKLALAVVAAGADPTAFGGLDLIALATAGRTTSVNPLFGDGVFDHALVMLALAAHGDAVPPTMIDALAATRIADGSWAFDGSTAPGSGDSNTTAMVIQALVVTGHGTDPMVTEALTYLTTVQDPAGGFAYGGGNPLVPDANSTALAIQAIIAAGQDPASTDWKNAAAALAAFQNATGAFRYTDAEPADNLFATVQAIPALAGLPLPIHVADAATPAASPVAAEVGTSTLPLAA